jgi:hypothetical protein
MSLVNSPFVVVHISRRDYADELSPNGEDHKQPSASVGLPKGVKPGLSLRVLPVLLNDERLVKEDLLAL